jgi:hypothetical protein
MLLVSKNNEVNFYGYDKQGNIHEVKKIGGRFFRCELVENKLVPVELLTEFYFND